MRKERKVSRELMLGYQSSNNWGGNTEIHLCGVSPGWKESQERPEGKAVVTRLSLWPNFGQASLQPPGLYRGDHPRPAYDRSAEPRILLCQFKENSTALTSDQIPHPPTTLGIWSSCLPWTRMLLGPCKQNLPCPHHVSSQQFSIHSLSPCPLAISPHVPMYLESSPDLYWGLYFPIVIIMSKILLLL